MSTKKRSKKYTNNYSYPTNYQGSEKVVNDSDRTDVEEDRDEGVEDAEYDSGEYYEPPQATTSKATLDQLPPPKKSKKKAKDADQSRKSKKSVDAPEPNDKEDMEQRRKINELVEAAGLNDPPEQRQKYNDEDVEDDSSKETRNGTSENKGELKKKLKKKSKKSKSRDASEESPESILIPEGTRITAPGRVKIELDDRKKARKGSDKKDSDEVMRRERSKRRDSDAQSDVQSTKDEATEAGKIKAWRDEAVSAVSNGNYGAVMEPEDENQQDSDKKLSKELNTELDRELLRKFHKGKAMKSWKELDQIVRDTVKSFLAAPGATKRYPGYEEVDGDRKKLVKLRDDLRGLCQAADEAFRESDSGGLTPRSRSKSKSRADDDSSEDKKKVSRKLKKPRSAEPLKKTDKTTTTKERYPEIVKKVKEMIEAEASFRINYAYWSQHLTTIDRLVTWEARHRIMSYFLRRTVNLVTRPSLLTMVGVPHIPFIT